MLAFDAFLIPDGGREWHIREILIVNADTGCSGVRLDFVEARRRGYSTQASEKRNQGRISI
jgi:hypothetical protein